MSIAAPVGFGEFKGEGGSTTSPVPPDVGDFNPVFEPTKLPPVPAVVPPELTGGVVTGGVVTGGGVLTGGVKTGGGVLTGGAVTGGVVTGVVTGVVATGVALMVIDCKPDAAS